MFTNLELFFFWINMMEHQSACVLIVSTPITSTTFIFDCTMFKCFLAIILSACWANIFRAAISSFVVIFFSTNFTNTFIVHFLITQTFHYWVILNLNTFVYKFNIGPRSWGRTSDRRLIRPPHEPAMLCADIGGPLTN